MKPDNHQTKYSSFDFFKELNGREMLHWIGTPCFIQEISKMCRDRVTIVTYDGQIFHEIKSDDLESVDPAEMALFI
jgi:hypothetical protein